MGPCKMARRHDLVDVPFPVAHSLALDVRRSIGLLSVWLRGEVSDFEMYPKQGGNSVCAVLGQKVPTFPRDGRG